MSNEEHENVHLMESHILYISPSLVGLAHDIQPEHASPPWVFTCTCETDRGPHKKVSILLSSFPAQITPLLFLRMVQRFDALLEPLPDTTLCVCLFGLIHDPSHLISIVVHVFVTTNFVYRPSTSPSFLPLMVDACAHLSSCMMMFTAWLGFGVLVAEVVHGQQHALELRGRDTPVNIPLEVFQVEAPVRQNYDGAACTQNIVQYDFTASYGTPFVGKPLDFTHGRVDRN